MKRFSKYFFLLTLGVSLGSCASFVDDLDIDPNNPAVVDAPNTIQGVMVADALVHEAEAARLSAMWTAQFTGVERQYVSLDRYDVTAGSFDDVWDTSYYGALTQARLTAANAGKTGIFQLQGVAQILEAHIAGTLTSLFGDIPFRQVGDRTQFPSPAYDAQTQVYSDVQALLDQAITNLGKTGSIPAAKDIFFSGSAVKWRGVANTLKARYFLQNKNYQAARTAAAAGISSAANSLVFPHQDVSGAQNVYFQFLVNERAGYLSATNSYAARILDPARIGSAGNHNSAQTDESARFAYYFVDATPGQTNYGIQEGDGFSAPDAAYPLVTYSENQLILAESAARLNDDAAALTALNAHRAALAAQFPTGRYLPYTVATLPGTGTTNQRLLREILVERYLTFMGQIEAFNDARRTNNALNVPIKAAVSSLPQRFLYPQSEVNTNANIPALPGLYEKTAANR